MISEILNLSSSDQRILEASNQVDGTLLITGQTGTGKSYLARQAHVHGHRSVRGGAFHKVNLASLSETLIESELFGHERGAFTGADSKRIGKIEMANGSTLFLDEIGELPLRIQAKLLDFIQYKKISPVGSNKEIALDVRIITATNRNLEEAVLKGDFRKDLFHRLNVFRVELPPLNEQKGAILAYARSFLEQKSKMISKGILRLEKKVESIFLSYEWPGNLRELENVIEFAVAMETSQSLRPLSLPLFLQNIESEGGLSDEESVSEDEKIKPTGGSVQIETPISYSFHDSKEQFERMYLEYMLRSFRGQINLTSRMIGLNKVSLIDKIRRFEIDWKKFRKGTVVNEAEFQSA